MNSSKNNLAALRSLMAENKISVYLIPSADPHLGEYIPDHWRIIRWLTGFTGSAATVVVTESFAGLWTDSRYLIQAKEQLQDSGFELVPPGINGNNDSLNWIKDNVENGKTVAFDGRIFSISRMRKLNEAMESKNIVFRSDADLISELWNDRPSMPSEPAFDHPLIFCGKSREVKLTEVRDRMKKQGADYHLLTSPDDIMWLLNIRGRDTKYSPLLASFAIVGPDQVLLFVDETKIPFRIAMEFDKLGIVILPYDETDGVLSSFSDDESIIITPGNTSVALFDSINPSLKIIESISIPSQIKAVKNKIEIENIYKVMVKDGIALTRFFFWLEQKAGSLAMTELSLGEKLDEFRSLQENFLGLSFGTIVAWNEHGAHPHYRATKETDSEISLSGILLIDSGGQYLDGTTDITRTNAIGRPTSKQKKDFTLVLKGMVNLAAAKFTAGTKGYQLDTLARGPLWDKGLNFGHGTGHGVGFCLNVHEGPQSISPSLSGGGQYPFEAGMLTSDEPALYREGEYGIRTENLLLCYEDEETEFGRFLKFDIVSLCYIDKNLIDKSLLNDNEIKLLNDYHSMVYDRLSPFLSDEEKVWLREKTDEI